MTNGYKRINATIAHTATITNVLVFQTINSRTINIAFFVRSRRGPKKKDKLGLESIMSSLGVGILKMDSGSS